MSSLAGPSLYKSGGQTYRPNTYSGQWERWSDSAQRWLPSHDPSTVPPSVPMQSSHNLQYTRPVPGPSRPNQELTEAEITRRAAVNWLNNVDQGFENSANKLQSAFESSYNSQRNYVASKGLDADVVWAGFWAKARETYIGHFKEVRNRQYDDLVKRRPRAYPSTDIFVTDGKAVVTVERMRDRSQVLTVEGEYKLSLGDEIDRWAEMAKKYKIVDR